MKLSRLVFDDIVCVPGAKDSGSAVARTDMREASFDAADGWLLERTAPMTFAMYREGMPAVVTIEGFPASYVEVTAPAEPAPIKKAGKR
jgi:hypothetical protein